MSKPAISKHLRVLEETGVLKREVVGRTHQLSLEPEVLSEAATWSYLDIAALGRQEQWEDSPDGYPQTPPCQWWKLHDEYGNGA